MTIFYPQMFINFRQAYRHSNSHELLRKASILPNCILIG